MRATLSATPRLRRQACSRGFAYAVDLAGVQAAHQRIESHVHRTPVFRSSAIDAMAGCNVHFKCEVFQRSGAFKIRGAANALLSLSPEELERGVVTQSSGNHGMAVALAAKICGTQAHVVVPQNTPACKTKAIEGYGARLIYSGNSMAEREAKAAEVQAATGAVPVHPYNDANVMAGQGTMALELLEQTVLESGVPLDAIVVPVSGGGMISGIAVAAKTLHPDLKIVAAEPRGLNDCADVAQSLAAGRWIGFPDIAAPLTICDGLRGHTKDLTWGVIQDWVDGAVAVSESEILSAMELLFCRMKLVVEPSAAVGLAAVMHPSFKQQFAGCENVGVILCGANIDLASFFELMGQQVSRLQ